MSLRIEMICDEQGTVLQLIGRIRSELLDELRALIGASRPAIVLDLDQVTLVDLDVVRFLAAAEREGVELRRCPPFIREWICRERDER